ncbi:MAG TPA: LysE family translocator [Devosia sp.]|nr:LysE family translocator [Devosia sp.]
MFPTILPFVITCLIIELTPGPNMGYLAVLSLERGRSAGFTAVAGITLGLLLLGLLAGFGVGAIIGTTQWLYESVRWAGVAFLLWLAWDSYRESRQPLETEPDPGRRWVYFRRGLVTNLLNPKAAVFYITVLPNFVGEGGDGWWELVLTLVYVAIASAVHAALVLLASTVRPLLSSSRLRSRTGALFALLLVGIAAWVLVSTHRVW